jgi:hypothetical protein
MTSELPTPAAEEHAMLSTTETFAAAEADYRRTRVAAGFAAAGGSAGRPRLRRHRARTAARAVAGMPRAALGR